MQVCQEFGIGFSHPKGEDTPAPHGFVRCKYYTKWSTPHSEGEAEKFIFIEGETDAEVEKNLTHLCERWDRIGGQTYQYKALGISRNAADAEAAAADRLARAVSNWRESQRIVTAAGDSLRVAQANLENAERELAEARKLHRRASS